MQARRDRVIPPNQPNGQGLGAGLYPQFFMPGFPQYQTGPGKERSFNPSGQAHDPVDDLNMSGLSLHGLGSNASTRAQSAAVPGNLVPFPSMTPAMTPAQVVLLNGRQFYPGFQHNPASFQQAGNMFNPIAHGGLMHPHFQNGHALQNITNGSNWGHFQHRDIPELAPRRNSLSSNEENGPHTPFFGAQPTSYHPKVAGQEYSPQGFGTPSPHQLSYTPNLAKSPEGAVIFYDFDSVCQQEPPIPRAIPAIFSGDKGRGTLDKSLVNQNNTTNVYIRGLHPNTTDEMLHAYGARFGEVESAKSMIDQQTGACKGFGFIKYTNFIDGENCIRAFFYWGYEAKWARVSHNEKLKTLADDDNTNLYVSNLPPDFNEHTLMATFGDHEVLSAKILRDENGLSRGVGFARFATPEICKKVIETYNGRAVGEQGHTISIRFADTPDQKKLKSVTAERRQYKTTEYNVAAYGPGSPYVNHTFPASFGSPYVPRTPVSSAFWSGQSEPATIFPTYAGIPAPSSVPTLGSIANVGTLGSENVAPNGRYGARIKIESPTAAALAKRSSAINLRSPVKTEENSATVTGLGISDVKTSPVKSIKTSPSKLSPTKANY